MNLNVDPTDSRIDISVVIPVYRSAVTLKELTGRLIRVLDGTGRRYEIIFVDDGSPDDSWRVLSELHAQCPDSVVAVRLTRNFGQHNALMCGFQHVRGRLIVTMDDDLQNPPEEIPKLLQTIEAGDYDVVYGRYIEKKHEPWRNLGSLVVNVFYRLVFRSRITVGAFRIIRQDMMPGVLSYNLNFTFVDGLLAWNTQRIGEVPVEHVSRQSGRSGYSLWKLGNLALNLFTNFSLLPLRLVSALGLSIAAAGSLAGFYYLTLFSCIGLKFPATR